MTNPFTETGSCVGSPVAQAILGRCEALGVVLSLAPGDGLAFDGPAGAMNDELLAELREHRAELLAMLGKAIQSPFILCPWCRLGDCLLDDPEGIQCERCGRLAWRWEGDAIERVDYVALLPITTPIDNATPSAGNGGASREAKATQSGLSWGE